MWLFDTKKDKIVFGIKKAWHMTFFAYSKRYNNHSKNTILESEELSIESLQ